MIPDLKKAVKKGFLKEYELENIKTSIVKDKYVMAKKPWDNRPIMLEFKDDEYIKSVKYEDVFKNEIKEVGKLLKSHDFENNTVGCIYIEYQPHTKKVIVSEGCSLKLREEISKTLESINHTLISTKTYECIGLFSYNSKYNIFEYANNENTAPEIGHAVVSTLTLFRDLPGTFGKTGVFKTLTSSKTKTTHPLKNSFIESENINTLLLKHIISEVEKELERLGTFKRTNALDENTDYWIGMRAKNTEIIQSAIDSIKLKEMPILIKKEKKARLEPGYLRKIIYDKLKGVDLDIITGIKGSNTRIENISPAIFSIKCYKLSKNSEYKHLVIKVKNKREVIKSVTSGWVLSNSDYRFNEDKVEECAIMTEKLSKIFV